MPLSLIFFIDFAFGKCLSQYSLEPEEQQREPLDEEQSALLATMLEDLQGAGLSWEHPFVQCRMQGTLLSIRNKTPMPTNFCGHLAPTPEVLGPQSPLAVVRFAPPNDDYADEVYYPPLKKAFDDRIFNNPPKSVEPPVNNQRHLDLGFDPSVPWELLTPEEKDKELYRRWLNAGHDNEPSRVHMRPMPLHGRRRDDNDDDDESRDDVLNVARRSHYQRDLKHADHPTYGNSGNADNVEDHLMEMLEHLHKQNEDEDESEEVPKTSFREVSREQHIPLDSAVASDPNELPSENAFLNQLRTHRLRANDAQPSGSGQASSNESPTVSNNDNSLPSSSSSSGVYTEGGLVYVPDGDETKERKFFLLSRFY